MIEGKPVYDVRKKLGVQLAEKIKKKWPEMEIDLVMPVPDTSRPAANALARTLGVPYEEGLVKNRYIGRTFIMPVQKIREDAVKLKLKPIESTIKGKNVMVVDDSIVRGTTSRRIVKLLRNSGAKKVYFVSTFPPISNPCFYGIDFQRREELIASGKTIKEIEKEIGAGQAYLHGRRRPSAGSRDYSNVHGLHYERISHSGQAREGVVRTQENPQGPDNGEVLK